MSDADPEQLLEAEAEALRAENAALVGEIAVLHVDNAALAGEVEGLCRRVDELTHRLSKGSKNSSALLSADSAKNKAEATKTRAARRAGAKATLCSTPTRG
jgi:peptidoglycan hydrolase CwlO-like protein